jgi:hypothetical protein
MFESKLIKCHSRKNRNPEPKNQYSWIPASAGMTNLKNINSPHWREGGVRGKSVRKKFSDLLGKNLMVVIGP